MNKFIKNIKTKAVLIIIFIFNMLPIKKNKIILFSYYGSQYGCNPKYITEYILANYPAKIYDLVWAFNYPNSVEEIPGVRKVKVMSLKYFFELSTAKIIITNFRTTEHFVKRKEQYYIQTWHSSLRLKQIEKDAVDTLPEQYVQMAQKDSLKVDLLLSGCKYSTDIFRRTFWYDGEIFEQGTPRNDLFFKSDHSIKTAILNSLNIPPNSKVVLYAPTFRKNNELEVYNLDYKRLVEQLKEKFEGDWVCLVKLHPHLLEKSKDFIYGKEVLDVTSYQDIQELLSISDVLVSDYSSLMFDFSLTKRPCFLYVPDLVEYINNDRNLYFHINELPFITANSNEELMSKIGNYENAEYQKNLMLFNSKIGTFENGIASKQLVQKINQVCFNQERSDLYEAI